MNHATALSVLGFKAHDKPTPQEIKKSYKKLALKLHPDKPGGSTKAFQKLGNAHDFLLSGGTPTKKTSETSRTATATAPKKPMNPYYVYRIIAKTKYNNRTYIGSTCASKLVRKMAHENGTVKGAGFLKVCKKPFHIEALKTKLTREKARYAEVIAILDEFLAVKQNNMGFPNWVKSARLGWGGTSSYSSVDGDEQVCPTQHV